jgi:hypothetical protein
MNPPPSLSARQLRLLRRGGIALIIYTIAVLVIVPWENVRHLLFVPYYPLLLALFGFGLARLGQHSRVGRWALLGWGMAVEMIMILQWVHYRSIMSDQSDLGVCLERLDLWTRTLKWRFGVAMSIGIVLALWGWVLHFRVRRFRETIPGNQGSLA